MQNRKRHIYKIHSNITALNLSARVWKHLKTLSVTDVEDGGLPDSGVVAALGVEGGVAGHEEVEVGRRDERRDQADQVRGLPEMSVLV